MRSHFMNMQAQADAPAIVTTGLWAWHDAADSGTITHESGRVTEWQDKSGNGCDVSMSSGHSARPYTGTRSMNGQNVLEFTGGERLVFPSTHVLGLGNSTVIAVYKADVAAHGYLISGRVGSRSYAYEMAVNTASNGILRVNHADSNNFTLWSGGSGLSAHTGILRRDGSSVEVLLDGSSKASSAATNVSLTGNMYYGVRYDGASFGFYYQGVLAEVLIYDRALSNAELAQNLTYLEAKWGL